MKNLFLILFLILIVGCHGTKKVTESRVIARKNTEVKESTAAQWLVSIDTTKLSDTETTYRKIEYYPPASASSATDTLRGLGSGLSTVQVKSVETLTIKKKTETKGKTEAVKSEENAKTTKVKESTNTKTEQEEKPAADPKRWRYIFYILVLLAGAFIYMKRSKAISWLKFVLSKVAGFLKI